jgi:hypothetical protein
MSDVVELAFRRTLDVSVRLLWHTKSDKMVVAIDTDAGEAYELPVLATQAFDAFENPHLYASRPGSLAKKVQ